MAESRTVRVCPNGDVGPRPATAALRSQAVERVVATMRDRLDEPLSLESMAGVAALSLYHFARVFQRVTGMPPARFLSALRLAEAKRLLVDTSLSVTDVCYRVGYNSLGSFTTRFTQSVGVSPGRFRRLQRGPQPLSDVRPWPTAAPDPDCAPPGSAVTGRVRDPVGAGGPVFVGLFSSPIPEGSPVRCRILPEPGAFGWSAVPDGTYYVFAVRFPDPDAAAGPGGEPAAPPALRVAAAPGPVPVAATAPAPELDLSLRPVRATDPPILVVLPVPRPDEPVPV
ncbi:MAG TPA: helix-turn-helix domain-containing protein [Micromonosporaceae bacterium]|nr:helix-turn-helix domain-containing protein [Micromonosporaceae bacterium]